MFCISTAASRRCLEPFFKVSKHRLFPCGVFDAFLRHEFRQLVHIYTIVLRIDFKRSDAFLHNLIELCACPGNPLAVVIPRMLHLAITLSSSSSCFILYPSRLFRA